MDGALVHAVDALAGSGPGWLFAIGTLLIVAFVAIKAIPLWNEQKLKQLGIEERREDRKAKEAEMRDERDRENAAIMARQVDAQERNTVVMQAVQEQLAVMNGQLDISHEGSRRMGEKVDLMAVQVDEMHGAIVKKD